ncbi:MAG: ABC transporter substrate-binding protein [Trueperaceae bacterium]|nr:ABC transporter substrate-binding protein [Trueperaceae bacterium]
MKRLLGLIIAALLLGPAVAQQDDSVEFGYVEWPGVTVKTQVASVILQELGYDTDAQALSVPLIFEGLSENDLDAFLGVWRPSMDTMLEDYLAESGGDGSFTLVNTNLEPTVYRPGVPTFVAEQGITSLADVAANADMFDGRIYGIEPGNDGNEIILTMIEEDTYGFSSMELVESSTAGMLAQVASAVEDEEPIVFLAWSPHWMNEVHDITYLDDPENVWGGDGYVATGLSTEWAENNPNLRTFFEQFTVTPDIQNAWIDAYSRQGNDATAVARGWVADNLSVVSEWLDGVETLDGESAVDAVQAAFAN